MSGEVAGVRGRHVVEEVQVEVGSLSWEGRRAVERREGVRTVVVPLHTVRHHGVLHASVMHGPVLGLHGTVLHGAALMCHAAHAALHGHAL